MISDPTSTVRGTPFCLLPHQAECFRSEAFIRGLVGGRYAGKTVFGCYDTMTDTVPDQNYLIVGPDYPAIMDGPFPQFLKIAKYLGIYSHHNLSPDARVICRAVRLDGTTGAIQGAGGKCRFQFRTGNNPESLRGGGRLKAWLDEASLMPQDVYDIVLPSLRAEFGGPSTAGRMLLTFTPKGKKHWTYSTFYRDGATANDEATPRPDTCCVHATSKDNFLVPAELYDKIASRFTTRMQDQELRGLFTEIEGLMFRREWLGEPISPKSVPMRVEGRVRYYDKAATENDGDWSCGVRVSRDYDGVFYVEDMIRGQWSYMERNRQFLETAKRDRAAFSNTIAIMEQEPAAGGKESFQRTLKEFTEAGIPVYRDLPGVQRAWRRREGQAVPGMAKIQRAEGFAANAEAGMVKIVRGDWNRDFLDEVTAFPETNTADIVDATSGAINRLAERTGLRGLAPGFIPAGPVDTRRFGVQQDNMPALSLKGRGITNRYPGLKAD